jgi:hypothetical protein
VINWKIISLVIQVKCIHDGLREQFKNNTISFFEMENVFVIHISRVISSIDHESYLKLRQSIEFELLPSVFDICFLCTLC